MLRYRARRSYIAPPPRSRRRRARSAEPLEQPEWDGTIHDLSKLKLSPEQQAARKLERVSRHQLRAGDAPEARAADPGTRERWALGAGRGLGGGDCGDDDDDGDASSRGRGAGGCLRGGDSDASSSGDDAAAARSRDARRAAWLPRDQQWRASGGGGDSGDSWAGGHSSWGGPRASKTVCEARAPGSAPRYAAFEDGSSSDEDDGGAPLVHVLAKQVRGLRAELAEAQEQLGAARSELEATQRELARAQDRNCELEHVHAGYVDRTAGVLAKLQAQPPQQQPAAVWPGGPAPAVDEDGDDGDELALALPSYAEMRRSAAFTPASAPPLPAAAAATASAPAPGPLLPSGLAGSNAARVPDAFWSAAAAPLCSAEPPAALARLPGPSLGAGLGPAHGAAPIAAAARRRAAMPPAGHAGAARPGGARGPRLHPEQAAASMSFLLHTRPRSGGE
ncbi:hypothetical protein Rsub_00477 [Raphidocelis subcapitata]|uniref:Uncharacterized protein n=1 Tax=Raphidocelis subcapitata TaxID=307507 RepID=A0A2V0NKD7_9CHLO|nr:hypothetical protein Rsub_00477 [Raphidocelis subcapitata]|eukprot:GBF87766.1 hypothetical protein Rsub_00477 [Raphidocelis subcapitata]